MSNRSNAESVVTESEVPAGHWVPTRKNAVRISIWYAVLGGLWIVGSGKVLHEWMQDSPWHVVLEDLKGAVFVFITACLLGLILDRYFSKIRSAVQRIRESEAKLHLVGDNLPDTYVFQFTRDPDGRPRFSYISAGVERVHRVSVADVLRDAMSLLNRLDPAQLPEFVAAEAESARTMKDVEMELRARRSEDEPVRTLYVRCRPRRNEEGRVQWDGFAQDISERKRTEEVLRLQGAALHAAANAIVITDRNGRIEWANPAFTTFSGYQTAEVIGQSTRLLKSGKHDKQFYEELWSTILDGKIWHKEMVNRRKDGKLYDEEMTITPLRDAKGAVSHFISIRQDITERKRLEAQFQQSQKMEAIGQLAGGVAHDFNNILAAMMMQTDLTAMTSNLPEEVREGLKQIRTAAERAARLTRQLLLFSRKQVMQTRDLDLNELVTSFTKMLQRIMGEDVRLQLQLHPAPLVTHADAGMLDQILMNLAVNARDAMPDGGELLIETAEKTLDEAGAHLHPDARAGRFVCLRVTDTGCGIPPETLPRIFEPFFTTKEAGKGTGLGLATVFGIVRQHRGWVQAHSQLGKGSVFEVFLPLSQAAAAEKEAALPKACGGTETILLAEDEPIMRLTTRKVLERHGYRVLEAANGVEAIKIWEQQQSAVALLLTDLVMPGGVSGQQLARKLQKERPDLKVILTSGYSANIAGRGIELQQGEVFLQKPYPLDQLLNAIRQSLDA